MSWRSRRILGMVNVSPTLLNTDTEMEDTEIRTEIMELQPALQINLTQTEKSLSLVPAYDSDTTSLSGLSDENMNTADVVANKKTSDLSSSSSSSSGSTSSGSSVSSSNSDSSSEHTFDAKTGPFDAIANLEDKDAIENTQELPANILIAESEAENVMQNTPLPSVSERTAVSDEEENVIQNTPEPDRRLSVYRSLENSASTKRSATNPPIVISPLYTDESDLDNDVDDPTYNFEDKFANAAGHKDKNFIVPPTSDSSSSDSDIEIQQRGRKRTRDPEKWKQNKVKRLRNQGKSYVSMSKTSKRIQSRCLKVACTKKCRFECTDKINTDNRYKLFDDFWKLGDLYKQRAYVKSCLVDVKPKYKYTNAERPRKPNNAYYFTVDDSKIRVCKLFFKSTLDISDRMIFTIQKKTSDGGFNIEDLRGKHGKHKKLSTQLLNDIRKHINSIPRIESHYVRATTTREYIDGGKTIKDLYEDFVEQQTKLGRELGNYIAYYKIFTNEFNLGFFQPKKDQCDLCVSYTNSNDDQKKVMEDKYQKHLKEKELCRREKLNDRKGVDQCNKVVIYDLEAVLQCPRGDTSAFYYKSKLNSYNLTLTELTKKEEKNNAYDHVHCYFWTESDAKRGANEIGTCVWNYLKDISNEEMNGEKNVIFYSDNCCGQNKNKYIATLYMYAVNCLNINSITHKFLIRGHTQNEADSVHSLIEKEVKKNLKSGPIYTPDQYIALIKNAKKSRPAINVYELTFESFMDIKGLQEDWGYNYSINTNGQNVNWNEIKQLKMIKKSPFIFYYKSSYEEDAYSEVDVRNKRKKMKPLAEITLTNAYTQKQELSANKKKDLKELMTKGLIPLYYANFYNSII